MLVAALPCANFPELSQAFSSSLQLPTCFFRRHVKNRWRQHTLHTFGRRELIATTVTDVTTSVIVIAVSSLLSKVCRDGRQTFAGSSLPVKRPGAALAAYSGQEVWRPRRHQRCAWRTPANTSRRGSTPCSTALCCSVPGSDDTRLPFEARDVASEHTPCLTVCHSASHCPGRRSPRLSHFQRTTLTALGWVRVHLLSHSVSPCVATAPPGSVCYHQQRQKGGVTGGRAL